MTIEEKQKADEKIVIDRFLPLMHITQQAIPSTRPDFIIELAAKKIGVEVTEFMYSDIKKENEIRQRYVMLPAQEIFESRNNSQVAVSAAFCRKWNVVPSGKQRRFDEIRDALVNYVEESVREGIPQRNSYEEYLLLQRHGLVGVLAEVMIFEGLRAPWDGLDAVAVRSIEDELDTDDTNGPGIIRVLNERIADKNNKYSEDIKRGELDEWWLLIYFSGFHESPIDVFDAPFPRERLLPSLFSKVIFYDPYWTNRFIILQSN